MSQINELSQWAVSQVMSQVSGCIWSPSKMAGKREAPDSVSAIFRHHHFLLAYRRLCPENFCAVAFEICLRYYS